MLSRPIPRSPTEAGVAGEAPGLAQIDDARLMAAAARDKMEGCGFSDHQILRSAETYIGEVGSGTVESFAAWMGEREAVAEAQAADEADAVTLAT